MPVKEFCIGRVHFGVKRGGVRLQKTDNFASVLSGSEVYLCSIKSESVWTQTLKSESSISKTAVLKSESVCGSARWKGGASLRLLQQTACS